MRANLCVFLDVEHLIFNLDNYKNLQYNIIKGVENMNNCIFIMLMQVNKMLRESETKTKELSTFEALLLLITIILFAYVMLKITFS